MHNVQFPLSLLIEFKEPLLFSVYLTVYLNENIQMVSTTTRNQNLLVTLRKINETIN
jgi:hypothetical protein